MTLFKNRATPPCAAHSNLHVPSCALPLCSSVSPMHPTDITFIVQPRLIEQNSLLAKGQFTFQRRYLWLLVTLFVLLAIWAAPAAAQESVTTPAAPKNDSNSVNRLDPSGPKKEPLIIIQTSNSDSTKYIIIGSVVGFLTAIVAVLLIISCLKIHHRFQQSSDTENLRNLPDHIEQEYPRKFSQGSTSGDRKLAQSAQMYHFQHQKQQLIAMESAKRIDATSVHTSSDADLDEDDTVYECPGLANSAGTMEVKNPMFDSAIDSSAMTPEQRQSPASPEQQIPTAPHYTPLP